MISGYWMQLITYFGINAIASLGFYFTYSSGQFSMAHVGFMGIAAFVSAIFSLKLGVAFGLAIIVGALAAAAAGILVSLLLAMRLKGMFQAIGTFAFSLVVVVLFQNLQYTGGPQGMYGLNRSTTTWLVFVILVVLVFILVLFRRSRRGLAFTAVYDDERAASIMGIDLARTKVVAYALGAFITGVGGALWAHYITTITPVDFSFGKLVDIILPPILGGMGTVWGTLLGTAVITFLPEALRELGIDRQLLWGLSLVILVVLRPQGLLERDTFPRLGRKIARATRSFKPQNSEKNGRAESSHLDVP